MAQWKVTVFREWTEYGTIEIEADSEEEARDWGMDALLEDIGIDWKSENMEPGNQGVENAEDAALCSRCEKVARKIAAKNAAQKG